MTSSLNLEVFYMACSLYVSASEGVVVECARAV